MSFTIEMDGKQVEFGSLPETTQQALAQRGVNHVLGNEVASKVSTAKKKAAEANPPEAFDEEAYKADAFKAKLDAIMNGTLGVRIAGVSHDPLAKYKREYAVLLLKQQYAKKGLKWPTGKGSGEVIAEMVSKVLNHPTYGPKATEFATAEVEKAKAVAGDISDILAD